jgi:hypothetical protein
MWAQQEQRSPSRIVSAARSLKSPGKRGGVDFSPRLRQRACQDPLTWQGGDALRAASHYGRLSQEAVGLSSQTLLRV